MKKENCFLILFMLFLNLLFGQQKTDETTNDFKQSRDTLVVYERFKQGDTLRIFKRLYYYDSSQALTLKVFEPLKFKRRIWTLRTKLNKPDKLVFVSKRICTVAEQRDVHALMESLLMDTKKEHRADCKKYNTKWFVTMGKRKESFKTCSCLLARLFHFKSQTSCPPEITYEGKGVY